jgi:hypothetical protein
MGEYGPEDLAEEFPFVRFFYDGPSAYTYLYCPAYVPTPQVWWPTQETPRGTPNHVPPGEFLTALFLRVVQEHDAEAG